MKKLLVLSLFLLMTGFVFGATCTAPGVNVAQNPSGSIVVCKDPGQNTCEQDFNTLCPTNYHLCSADEYNAGNDNWVGDIPTWLLGEITCRSGGGAGHYTIEGGSFSTDMPFNQYAGSSLPQCPSDYGCNEQQYDALCCVTPDNNVPEFGVIAGVLAALGAVGVFIVSRKQ